jgi:Protein of unknown function (DUF4232)
LTRLRIPRAWLRAAVVTLAVALATTDSSASETRAAVSAATPGCATSGLVIWLNTQSSGAAGSSYYNLELTNLSGRACSISGYPGVSAVNLAGRQLGAAAARDRAQPPHLLTLAAGATATVLLRITDVANFPASSCRQVIAAGLRVYPPNQTGAKVVPFPFRACSRRGPTYLSVRSAKKG